MCRPIKAGAIRAQVQPFALRPRDHSTACTSRHGVAPPAPQPEQRPETLLESRVGRQRPRLAPDTASLAPKAPGTTRGRE